MFNNTSENKTISEFIALYYATNFFFDKQFCALTSIRLLHCILKYRGNLLTKIRELYKINNSFRFSMFYFLKVDLYVGVPGQNLLISSTGRSLICCLGTFLTVFLFFFNLPIKNIFGYCCVIYIIHFFSSR